jgi:hypothetical protein
MRWWRRLDEHEEEDRQEGTEYDDDEDYADSGPLQLADLMDMSGSPGSPGPLGFVHPDEQMEIVRERCIRNVQLVEDDSLPYAESCQICFETPLIRNALKTDCGHHYCRDCFDRWEDCKPNCPTCRSEMPVITGFSLTQI